MQILIADDLLWYAVMGEDILNVEIGDLPHVSCLVCGNEECRFCAIMIGDRENTVVATATGSRTRDHCKQAHNIPQHHIKAIPEPKARETRSPSTKL